MKASGPYDVVLAAPGATKRGCPWAGGPGRGRPMGKLMDGQGGASKAAEQHWGCCSGVWVSSVEESWGV